MDKRTLLAVILSVIVLTISFVIQGMLFPPASQETPIATESTSGNVTSDGDQSETPVTQRADSGTVSGQVVPQVNEDPAVRQEDVVFTTNKYIATFSNAGGVLTSLRLKEHREGTENVEMLISGSGKSPTFDVAFGGPDARPVNDLFRYRKGSDNSIEFYRTFSVVDRNTGEPVPFTFRKKYVFTPDDYMIELQITVENSINEVPNLVNSGFAYTLELPPQIGPAFEDLSGQRDYRKFFIYQDGKRKDVNAGKQGSKVIDDRIAWAAVAGKYFTLIAVPDATLYATEFSSEPYEGLIQANKISFSRPPLKSSKNTDIFRFFIGPKLESSLARFNDAEKNGFGTQDLQLDKVQDSSPILGWLEAILKFILLGFYKVIPNYGVAIILLTILTKVVLFPLTHKSIESTSKMQALAPKVEEIKQKYKNSPNKMNQEMAELYKREGANPLGGCLPMLLQIPIFFALYNLLNSHFDLRGSVFIPGWINDLSAPESILSLPFTVPFLNWTDLRLLPFIYVGTQILTSKFTTAPESSANANMKMMMYMMPIVFFFIMYNMPSGLLLYWTMTNILSTAQQIYSTRHLKAKRAADGGSPVRK